MVNIKTIKCLECGKEFTRDMDNPKVIKAYEQMGAVADQCSECLRKWLGSN